MAASSDDRGNERSGGGGDSEQEERTDGWMTSYADMVTLLMTFFVLMFALSNADTAKMEMFMAAMSRDGLTYEQFLEIQDRFEPSPDAEWDDDYFPPPAWDSEEEDEDVNHGGDQALQDLHDAIGGYIDDMGFGDNVNIVFNGEFIMMTLSSDILFDSGMADITPYMNEVATMLGQLLARTFLTADPFEVVVAGHTDNVPIGTARFPSNWHLSVARSVNFLEVLITESGLDPSLFYARGAGEERPLGDNNTEEGRAINRRVEVMISLARENPMWDGANRYD